MLVIDGEGRLRGIFSERIPPRVAGIHECWEHPVCEVMTADPETVGLTDTLALTLSRKWTSAATGTYPSSKTANLSASFPCAT